MSGFTDPLVGGGGNLVYPSIQSPNFTLIPLTGWAIMKNGTAYFASIIVGGTVNGASIVGSNFSAGTTQINSAGIFQYVT